MTIVDADDNVLPWDGKTSGEFATGQWPDCADEVPYDFRQECEWAKGVPGEIFGF